MGEIAIKTIDFTISEVAFCNLSIIKIIQISIVGWYFATYNEWSGVMEISNDVTYIIKVNSEFVKITGRDIILAINDNNEEVIAMYDRDTDIEDIKNAIKSIK